ncbi:hypothetical protein Btru_066202 [Bulinus truncatus]|nr:hypothetical protein Btru_066202 [Bulinus truncatus]
MVGSSDDEEELEKEFDQCPVCIEAYKAHDVIRMLPCRHVFHKSCVDPWLLDQRSCPMCKLDILRAYGMQVGGSQESVRPDPESNHATLRTVVQQDEPEASSSLEETHSDEIKVLLVPHACLHFHPGRDKAAATDEASSSLLSATGGSVLDTAPRSKACNSRVEKFDEEAASGSSEMKSLLQQNCSENVQHRWESIDEKGNLHDEVDGRNDASYGDHHTESSRESHTHNVAPEHSASSSACSPSQCEKSWEQEEDCSTCSCVSVDSQDESQTVCVATELHGLYHNLRESTA